MTTPAPLQLRLSSPEERLRVLLLTNEEAHGDHPGQHDSFDRLVTDGTIEAFAGVGPKVVAKSKGQAGALREILDLIRGFRPNVLVFVTPQGFPFTRQWLQEATTAASPPVVLYWEGDPWARWRKPPGPEMPVLWRAADVVFTVAVGKQRRLIERYGACDVRFVPNTYDHVVFSREEANEPPTGEGYEDVVIIGNHWGHRWFFSRLPGARERRRFVRGLQRNAGIPLAIYGRNWTGRGVRGPVHFREQAATARSGFVTANWDHFADYVGFASDRLAIQLLAGRAHVTTSHPGYEWLPGSDSGLFKEPTVSAAIWRVQQLLKRPRDEVFELGLAAHRWARHRLSHREAALYMLGAVDERLLRRLPDDPWNRLPS